MSVAELETYFEFLSISPDEVLINDSHEFISSTKQHTTTLQLHHTPTQLLPNNPAKLLQHTHTQLQPTSTQQTQPTNKTTQKTPHKSHNNSANIQQNSHCNIEYVYDSPVNSYEGKKLQQYLNYLWHSTKKRSMIVRESLIPGAGNGVFAPVDIPDDLPFGKYVGKIVSKEFVMAGLSESILQIRCGVHKGKYIDGKEGGNWTAFLNGSNNWDAANVYFTPSGYIKSKQDICKNEELIAYYGTASDYPLPVPQQLTKL